MKKGIWNLTLGTLALMVLSGVAYAHSAIASTVFIEVDLETPGDAFVTYDTNTGLQWLDVPLTFELSVNEAIGTKYVQDLGFRHATDAEIRVLLENFGITDLTGTRVEENYAGGRLMLDLMGPGYDAGTLEVLSGFYASTDPLLAGWLSVDVPTGGTINGRARISPDVFLANEPQEGSGNYLVRDVPVVPLPAALLQTLHSNVTGAGPGKILEKTVAQAQTYYAVPDVQATCAVMRFFDYEVRVIWRLSNVTKRSAPWKITTEQMDDWLGQSGSIQIAIGCN